ncbi:MAG TPA: VCBS repeat-containing protein [Polyangia bacterium]|jgi:hypothetical protein
MVALSGALACSSNPKSGAGAPTDASAATGGAPGATGGSGGAPSVGSGGMSSGAGTGGRSASGGTSEGGGHAATGGIGDSGGHPATGGAASGGMNGSGTGGMGSPGGTTAGSGGGGHGGAAGAQWSSTFPTFIKHAIASFSSGYATVIADIDHDGKPDVVALSSASAGLVWFKNPSWTKYTITSKAKALIFMAPYDIDGDGDLDVAIASDFSMTDTTGGGTISWAEAPADPTQNQEWDLHKIGAIPTTHRLRWGDIDGDGKKELIALPIFGVGSMSPAYAGAVQLTAFTIPKDPKGDWTAGAKVLDNQHLEVAHGLQIVDWDGDKAEDILAAANAGVYLYRPSLGSMAEHLGAGAAGQAPTKGSSEVALGSLGGARFFATIDPWHGTDAVIYTPGASSTDLWNRQVLGTVFEHGHGLAAADFNGDGFDEIVGGGGQGTMAQLIFRYVPSTQQWDQIQLDVGGVAVSGIDVKDMDGDGDIDIVSIGGSPTNNVVWYENTR